MSFSSSRAKTIFGAKEAYQAWAIEWQMATGRLLMANSKTRELGKEKMVDAIERKVEMEEDKKADERVERGEES